MPRDLGWEVFTLPPCLTGPYCPCSGAPPFLQRYSAASCLTTTSLVIINIDLELAASVVQHEVLVTNMDAREATFHNFSDNTPPVYWQRKGAVSTSGPAARLLRLQAIQQRLHRYVPTYDYIPGPANVMSDDSS
jgi:hypothetical protein